MATTKVDAAVLQSLPRGTKIFSIETHSTSTWASTAKITAESADGSLIAYFLKIVRSSDAADRVLGEYMSMSEIHKTLPSIAPQPHDYGRCRDDEDAHFFLCEFLDMVNDDLPGPVRLGETLAELHRKSQSPTGKFGFHCTTFDGKLPLTTTWESSWPTFFTRMLQGVYDLDVQTNGPWPELDAAMKTTVEKVIPRLLDALTASGRTIKPTLIHGDLWESNIGTDAKTGEIYIYDACAYYAHHEKELGIWRCEHHEMTKDYREAYCAHMPKSEPQGEFDDRNRLYSIETLLIHSAHFPGAETRARALKEMNWLIGKYCRDV